MSEILKADSGVRPWSGVIKRVTDLIAFRPCNDEVSTALDHTFQHDNNRLKYL